MEYTVSTPDALVESRRWGIEYQKLQVLPWVLVFDVMKRALALAITGISLYLVFPGLVELWSSFPELASIQRVTWTIIGMFCLEAMSFASLWWLQHICFRTASWKAIITSQLSSNAVGRIVPAGAPAAAAMQYRMLTEDGVKRADVGTGTAVLTLITQGALLGLPLLALPAIWFGPPVNENLVRGATVALIAFVGALLLGAALLLRNRPVRWVGKAFDALLRLFRRPEPAVPAEDRMAESRVVILQHLQALWPKALVAAVGKWAFDFAALMLAISAATDQDLTLVFLLSYVTASLLGLIPLTPGGLGFVEAGLTGTLALAGLSAGDAIVVTLAYRLVSFWLPIPIGALAYLVYRRGLDQAPTKVVS